MVFLTKDWMFSKLFNQYPQNANVVINVAVASADGTWEAHQNHAGWAIMPDHTTPMSIEFVFNFASGQMMRLHSPDRMNDYIEFCNNEIDREGSII